MTTTPSATKRELSSGAFSSGSVAVHSSDTGSLGALSYSDPLTILGAAPLPHEPWWQRFSPSTLYVLLACAIAIFFLGHELAISGQLGFPNDDAWTQQVFARNFFHHVAFEFNAGERVASPESPFWIVFLAVGIGLFHDPILTAKLLGSICLFLTGYYAYRILQTAAFDRLAALIGGALVMTSSALAASELSGLETCLASALIMGAIWWHTADPHDGWSHAAISGAVFALAALTQPEATLVFAAVLLFSFFSGAHRLRNVLFMLLAFSLIVAPIAITNYLVGGTLLPPAVLAAIEDHWASLPLRLVTSVTSIWVAVRDIYLRDNPLWLFTVLAATLSRVRRTLVVADVADHLLSLALAVLIAAPYLYTVVTGSGNLAGHDLTLLLPIYELAGILSIHVLVRRELFRLISPKQALIAASIILLFAGASVALFSSDPVGAALLLILILLLSAIAFDHVGIPLWKTERRQEVTEAERLETSFQRIEDGHSNLSSPAIKVLSGVLMIVYAWNIARLPHAARDFAVEVGEENRSKIGMAHAVASLTPPQDAVAAFQIGAIGYFGDRHVVDLSGELSAVRGSHAIALGQPKHLAIFSEDDTAFVRRALSRGLLSLEVRSNANEKRAELYRVTSSSNAAWTQP